MSARARMSPQASGAVVEPHPSPYPFMLTSAVLLSLVAAHQSSIATTSWVPQVEMFLTALTSMQLQHKDEFVMYFYKRYVQVCCPQPRVS